MIVLFYVSLAKLFMSSVLKEKTYSFSIQIVKLCRGLIEDKKEYILSKQVLRSGTAIGALVAESIYAQSKADFIHKLSISMKEANETEYWINLLKDTDIISEADFSPLNKDLQEIIRILISSIKTAKANNK
jgi:four helix bundle protein